MKKFIRTESVCTLNSKNAQRLEVPHTSEWEERCVKKARVLAGNLQRKLWTPQSSFLTLLSEGYFSSAQVWKFVIYRDYHREMLVMVTDTTHIRGHTKNRKIMKGYILFNVISSSTQLASSYTDLPSFYFPQTCRRWNNLKKLTKPREKTSHLNILTMKWLAQIKHYTKIHQSTNHTYNLLRLFWYLSPTDCWKLPDIW